MSQIISLGSLQKIVGAWIDAGKSVFGPTRVKEGLVLTQRLASADKLALTGFVRPGNSIKEAVFPRHETLYSYRFVGKQIELTDAPLPEMEQVVIGSRPCDAAALSALDAVFNWDFPDVFYNHRRNKTTIVTLACSTHDEHCFCTTVGLAPDDPRGSDVLLLPIDETAYEVRCLTEKGKRLFDAATQPSDKTGKAAAGPAKAFDAQAVESFLADGFEDPAWHEAARRCLGCGACAYGCPTCHCFDIVDEGNAAGGVRARNWDACQFSLFTLHASGHNPRANQGQRARQRILHKFKIYPDKFGQTLCTGCGNCTRNCPVGLGVLPVLTTIQRQTASK